MKKYFYYIASITVSTILTSCSAAYWSGSSFEGDDMYGTHSIVSTTKNQNGGSYNNMAKSYGYQRPDSYYQYQYVATDEQGNVVSYDPNSYVSEQDSTNSIIVIDPKYASSTYGVWEDEQKSAVSNTYINVSYSYDPWWGYGYDPFFYGGWRHPYYSHHYPYYSPYYGDWWWHRPYPIYVSKRPKQNIVHLPSSGGHTSSSRKKSESYRGQSVGTTTSGRFSRSTTMFNSNNSSNNSSSSSSSSSSKSPSSSSSGSSSSTTTYSAPVRPTTYSSPSSSSPSRSYSTPSSSSGSSSRSSSAGGSSSR